MSAASAARSGSGQGMQWDGSNMGTARSATPSSPVLPPPPAPVSMSELLLSANQDPLTALANLVTSYNTLLTTQSATQSQSVVAERDRLADQNLKLFSVCSQKSKEAQDARVRVVELESILKANNLPLPPARSQSASPVEELNVPLRPRNVRSFSDEPPRLGSAGSDASSRKARSPNGQPNGQTLSSSISEKALASPKPISSIMFPAQAELEDAPPDSPSPVPTPTTARPTHKGLSRKASSLDLGRRGTQLATPGSRSQTPPPSSSPKQQKLGSVTPIRGESADALYNALPAMAPMSPFFPPSSPSRSESVPAVPTIAHSSPYANGTHNGREPLAAVEAPRQRAQSDAPALTHQSSDSTSSIGKPRELSTSPSDMSAGRIDGELAAVHAASYAAMRTLEPRSSSQQLRGASRADRRPPTLTPPMLAHLSVRVVNSSIKSDSRGREMVSFTVETVLQIPPENDRHRTGGQIRWLVEKSHADVLNLDTAVRAKNSRSQLKKVAVVPDKSLFKDHAPNKVDQRKAVLQSFLQSIVAVPLQERGEVCTFFNTNVVSERSAPVSNPAHKAGHLTKKGRSLGGWQTRYYVLNGPQLDYYENQGGPHLGSINLVGAQIGRQQNNETSQPDSYRHAFLIRERVPKKDTRSRPEDHDHILCAESDSDRDSWVRALAAWHTGEYVEPPEVMSANNRTGRSATKSLDVDRPSTEHRRLAHKESRDESRLYMSASASKSSEHIPPAPPFGQHGRQQSFGQASSASMHDGEHHHRHLHALPNGLQRALHLNEISSSTSAPSALNEMAQQGRSMQPPVLQERPASAAGHHAESHSTPHQRMTSQGSNHLLGADEQKRSSPSDHTRPMSPDRKKGDREDSSSSKKSISGPRNAMPITDGHGFKNTTPTRKDEDRRARTKSSFWNFASRSGKDVPGLPVPAIAARPVFGVPLSEAVQIASVREDFDLPAVVFRCIEYLEGKSAQAEEGIYRLSGSTSVMKNLKDRFNTEGDVNLLASGEYYDVHAIAGLLKTYLRELPVHILTRELQPHFFSVNDDPDKAAKIDKLGLLIGQLPTPNYNLLRFLIAHLSNIVDAEEVNKMSLRNMGIVFAPTLQLPAWLFAMLIADFRFVFRVNADGQHAPAPLTEDDGLFADGVTTEAKGPRRKSRNSQIYEASGADRLLESGGRLQSPREEDDLRTTETSDYFTDAAESVASPSEELQVNGASLRPRSPDKRDHGYREKGRELNLQINSLAPASNSFIGLPASPRSPLHTGSSSPQSLRVPNSPLGASPRHAARA